jgi:hypothetical protein
LLFYGSELSLSSDFLQVVPSPNGFTQLFFVGAANFGCVRILSGFVLANMFDPTSDGQVFSVLSRNATQGTPRKDLSQTGGSITAFH